MEMVVLGSAIAPEEMMKGMEPATSRISSTAPVVELAASSKAAPEGKVFEPVPVVSDLDLIGQTPPAAKDSEVSPVLEMTFIPSSSAIVPSASHVPVVKAPGSM